MTAYADTISRPARTLTESEQRLLLKFTGQRLDGFRDHVIYSIALGAGLREHEILALDVGDVFDDSGHAKRRLALRVFKRASDDPAAKKPKKARRRKAPKDAPVEAVPGASPAVVKALLAAIGDAAGEDDPEVLASVEDAVAALALKEATPRLEELCKSSWPALREHAQRALALLSGGQPTCDPPVGGGEAPPELAAIVVGPQRLTFDTDVGALSVTLDPAVAPVAVTRVVGLARAGFYDGLVVHRVVPGFVSQLGAPRGDGYGGPPGKRPLRCETSPLGFGPLRVGVALSGRDTGSSQIFVTHAAAPHLDGQYAWLGTAEGPWAALVDGDVIRKVAVTDAK